MGESNTPEGRNAQILILQNACAFLSTISQKNQNIKDELFNPSPTPPFHLQPPQRAPWPEPGFPTAHRVEMLHSVSGADYTSPREVV